MKVKNVAAGAVLAVGLGVGSLAGAVVTNAAPGAPNVDIVEKPHHDDWGWDDDEGWGNNGWGNNGWGRGGWGYGGWGHGVQACVSATGPWGYVQGSVCI